MYPRSDRKGDEILPFEQAANEAANICILYEIQNVFSLESACGIKKQIGDDICFFL